MIWVSALSQPSGTITSLSILAKRSALVRARKCDITPTGECRFVLRNCTWGRCPASFLTSVSVAPSFSGVESL